MWRTVLPTLNLLVDFDQGEIYDVKEDERHLERTVFIQVYRTLANRFSEIFMALAIRAGRPFGKDGLRWCT